jgi:hypothetical protein
MYQCHHDPSSYSEEILRINSNAASIGRQSPHLNGAMKLKSRPEQGKIASMIGALR